jgi:hypothetical protein
MRLHGDVWTCSRVPTEDESREGTVFVCSDNAHDEVN